MKPLYWKDLGDTIDSQSTEAKFNVYVSRMDPVFTAMWKNRMVEPARWSKTAHSPHVSIRSIKEVTYILRQEFLLLGQKP